MGEEGSRGCEAPNVCCMPNVSRLLSAGAASFAGFKMEGTAIGGSCVGAKRGSTGPEGCQEAGRRRPEPSASEDWLSNGAFLFLPAELGFASADAAIADAVAGADAGGASSDESDKDRVCDMGTLMSQ